MRKLEDGCDLTILTLAENAASKIGYKICEQSLGRAVSTSTTIANKITPI